MARFFAVFLYHEILIIFVIRKEQIMEDEEKIDVDTLGFDEEVEGIEDGN